MTNALHTGGIAHGDLQHGNVLVRNGEPILVDFDGMWVPELSHLQSNDWGIATFSTQDVPRRTTDLIWITSLLG